MKTRKKSVYVKINNNMQNKQYFCDLEGGDISVLVIQAALISSLNQNIFPSFDSSYKYTEVVY